MNKYIAGNLIFNCIYTTLFVTLVCGNEENSMPWWATVITAIVLSIYGGGKSQFTGTCISVGARK